jgi:hypothetical protein
MGRFGDFLLKQKRRSNQMKNATQRMRLACLLVLTMTVAAFGQQTANQEANAQHASTYNDRD